MSENSRYEKNLKGERYSIKVLSNIVVNQLGDILEYGSRKASIPAIVSFGDYDNIIQDGFNPTDANLVIIFWELPNFIEGLHYRVDALTNDEMTMLEEKIVNEILLVFDSLESIPLVLFNRFSSLLFNQSTPLQGHLETLANRLNNRIDQMVLNNIHLVNVDKVIATVGIQNSADFRYFYSSKALYTIAFFQAYVNTILPYILAANGKMKKAIIFDCDNTLWGGILGEDGLDNISLSPNNRVGTVFSEVQGLALSLKKNQGVLLGLCSKNNPADVDKVLDEHPDMLIKKDDLSIKKVNWNDKVSNLKQISNELNIGLDSIVFVDDSDFEVELIKKELPEITVLKVPTKIYKYPMLLRNAFGLFFGMGQTDEDRNKTQIYKQQNERKAEEKSFSNIDDYLESLGLKIRVYVDDSSSIMRLAQISQKTNQFNLTTTRYTDSLISKLILESNVRVVSISVSDKFGESGITGLCILKFDRMAKAGHIETLLMSCRIIGRNIEYAFMDTLICLVKKEGVSKLNASYRKTSKNEQVSDFYTRCGFTSLDTIESVTRYSLDVNNYKEKDIKYIEVLSE
ncbi:HAD-IIIC family phosphatase [Litorivicinus sp.]|nr:HAD-IIIC family phosphatase [Litorivicinus sp.]